MDWTMLIVSLLVGGLFSYIYFKGLWLTVSKLSKSKHPSTMILISFVLRSIFLMVCIVALFWYASYYALASIISFIAIRSIMIIKYQSNEVNAFTIRKENNVK
jgi:F1F0 ATPase subunit 2